VTTHDKESPPPTADVARLRDDEDVSLAALSGPEYAAVFEAAPDGIVVVDESGTIRDVNPQGLDMFDYEREDLVGRSIEVLVPEPFREAHVEERDRYLDDPHARPMGIGMELAGRRRDGSRFPVEISLSPMTTSHGRQVIAIVRDMTEPNRLRAFGISALRAAEEERQRIARELHDDTAQRLAALMMRLRVTIQSTDGQEKELLEDARQEIEEVVEGIRRIARGLRPPALDEVGVVAAIRSHARSLEENHGVEVEFHEPDEPPGLAPDQELALYRIVQEALSNVVRHADAARVRVAMEVDSVRLHVAVEDDGRGFDPRRAEGGMPGLGLIGMRERVRNAGGSFELDAGPGRGTRVRVSIPRTEA